MQASGGLAWFVQVSDIHLSRYAQQQMPQFGDKEGDWGYFASNVLHHLAPGALVLTGDLVDGKTKLMRGSQDAGEWKVSHYGLHGVSVTCSRPHVKLAHRSHGSSNAPACCADISALD
jgi:hypothetical protein